MIVDFHKHFLDYSDIYCYDIHILPKTENNNKLNSVLKCKSWTKSG